MEGPTVTIRLVGVGVGAKLGRVVVLPVGTPVGPPVGEPVGRGSIANGNILVTLHAILDGLLARTELDTT